MVLTMQREQHRWVLLAPTARGRRSLISAQRMDVFLPWRPHLRDPRVLKDIAHGLAEHSDDGQRRKGDESDPADHSLGHGG